MEGNGGRAEGSAVSAARRHLAYTAHPGYVFPRHAKQIKTGTWLLLSGKRGTERAQKTLTTGERNHVPDAKENKRHIPRVSFTIILKPGSFDVHACFDNSIAHSGGELCASGGFVPRIAHHGNTRVGRLPRLTGPPQSALMNYIRSCEVTRGHTAISRHAIHSVITLRRGLMGADDVISFTQLLRIVLFGEKNII